MKLFLAVLLVGLAWLSALASSTITGAGATFPYPLYSKWFSEYAAVEPSIQFNYQSIGSGGGIRQFLEKTVDFGASDAPMTTDQLKKATTALLHIPTVLGAVVVTYQIPGVAARLKLTPEVLADIFLGKITKWNDPRLTSINRELVLPGQDIIVVHRSDGSGTTYIFTDYLTKVSPEWKSRVGTGTAVKWPTGLGGKGNEGVSGLVRQTPGSIGYVEHIYAKSNQLAFGSLKNKAGEFVDPEIGSVTQAAAGVTIPDDFRVSLTDAPGKGAYPISGFTYLLVWKQRPDGDLEKEKTIQRFLRWAVTTGQKYAAPLGYAPLPSDLVARIEAKLNEAMTAKRDRPK